MLNLNQFLFLIGNTSAGNYFLFNNGSKRKQERSEETTELQNISTSLLSPYDFLVGVRTDTFITYSIKVAKPWPMLKSSPNWMGERRASVKQVSIQHLCSCWLHWARSCLWAARSLAISSFMACVHRLQSQEITTFKVQDDKRSRSMKLPSVVYHLLSTVVHGWANWTLVYMM